MKKNTEKEINAFQEVNESIEQNNGDTPIEATDCEVEEAVKIINLDKETSDRG